MLNKFTQEQFNKLRISIPDGYSQAIIPQHSLNGVEIPKLVFTIGHTYRVLFEKYIVEPYEGFTLHINYNHGNVPQHRNVIGTVENISSSGKMVLLNTTDGWCGWVPVSACTIFEEVIL